MYEEENFVIFDQFLISIFFLSIKFDYEKATALLAFCELVKIQNFSKNFLVPAVYLFFCSKQGLLAICVGDIGKFIKTDRHWSVDYKKSQLLWLSQSFQSSNDASVKCSKNMQV